MLLATKKPSVARLAVQKEVSSGFRHHANSFGFAGSEMSCIFTPP
ncbi:hypothetical protein [Halorussus caseinilyticus]|uniref:Uncharacterized protein n=1 Tax=Halorussus caseinilyticus TaxID=3034025 RepID=A0ABD5WUK1_9EURY